VVGAYNVVIKAPFSFFYDGVGGQMYKWTENDIYRDQYLRSLFMGYAMSRFFENPIETTKEGVVAQLDRYEQALYDDNAYEAGVAFGEIGMSVMLAYDAAKGIPAALANLGEVFVLELRVSGSSGGAGLATVAVAIDSAALAELLAYLHQAGVEASVVMMSAADEGPSSSGGRPEVNTGLPDRVTRELPPGEMRTPAENARARNFFERHRDAARRWWEERTSREWPTDSTHDEHPRPLKDGGDPLYVEPGYGGPNAEHSIPRPPDGLTDAQRWGRIGGQSRGNS
jgi:hypothetical protein